jgi:hypothetical protein
MRGKRHIQPDKWMGSRCFNFLAAVKPDSFNLGEMIMNSARRLFSSLFLTTMVGLMPQIVKADCPDWFDFCKDKCSCSKDKCSCDKDKCCCPRKVIIKHPRFYGPAPAPVGYAVPSAAIMPVHIPTFAFTSSAVAPASAAVAGPTADEMREFRAMLAQNRAGSVAAAGPNPLKCDDPCGEILQLRKDLNALIIVTDKLSIAVEKIANNPALATP